MAKLYVNEKNKQGHINPEIYGHFAEHLGRCIYEGIYVGEDSPIPNKNGMRTDVVEALKRCGFLFCAGRVDVLQMNITGWMESVQKKTERK